MKSVLEKIRIVKQTSVKTPAWVNGVIETVYIQGNQLNGSRAKIFHRDIENKKVDVIRGRTYLNEQNILYFIPD